MVLKRVSFIMVNVGKNIDFMSKKCIIIITTKLIDLLGTLLEYSQSFGYIIYGRLLIWGASVGIATYIAIYIDVIPNKVAIPYYYGIARWPVLLTINLVNEASSKYFIRGGNIMDNKNKVTYENKKTGRKFSFENVFSKKDIWIVLIVTQLVKLFTNENFLDFVVKIV